MSLAYTPRITRSTWEPARPSGRHRLAPARRDTERTQPTLPNGAIAASTAAVIGLALVAHTLPVTVVGTAANPSTKPGQTRIVPDVQLQNAAAYTRDTWLAKTAHPSRPAHDEQPAHHKQGVHHKAASIRTNVYFGQFSQTGDERKHNAALIIEIGKKRGFSDRSIAVAVGTSIQESGLRNLDWGDRDSLGLYQQRPSVKAWGTAKQILDPVHAINRFYDGLAGVRGRDSMPMMRAAIEVQRPNPFYYERDWRWDRVATLIVSSYVA